MPFLEIAELRKRFRSLEILKDIDLGRGKRLGRDERTRHVRARVYGVEVLKSETINTPRTRMESPVAENRN
jgi:hypothetical protein